MVYQWQHLLYDQRYSQTDLGQTPDFVKLAESFGIASQRITEPKDTEEAINKAIKDNESVVLDIIVEKNEFLPMVPPGSAVTDVLGKFEYENDISKGDD